MKKILLVLGILVFATGAYSQRISEEVVEKVIRTAVKVVPVDNDLERIGWTGSGTIISPDGYILTNFHVIEDRNGRASPYAEIRITENLNELPEHQYYAEYINGSQDDDLAILKIVADKDGSYLPDDIDPFPYLQMGDVESLKPLDSIYVFGYPGVSGSSMTITQGVISGFTGESKYRGGNRWVKTDAQIAKGNSGGTGINSEGVLVAIPTAVNFENFQRDENSDILFQNQNILRPASMAIDLLRDIPTVEYTYRAKQEKGLAYNLYEHVDYELLAGKLQENILVSDNVSSDTAHIYKFDTYDLYNDTENYQFYLGMSDELEVTVYDENLNSIILLEESEYREPFFTLNLQKDKQYYISIEVDSRSHTDKYQYILGYFPLKPVEASMGSGGTGGTFDLKPYEIGYVTKLKMYEGSEINAKAQVIDGYGKIDNINIYPMDDIGINAEGREREIEKGSYVEGLNPLKEGEYIFLSYLDGYSWEEEQTLKVDVHLPYEVFGDREVGINYPTLAIRISPSSGAKFFIDVEQGRVIKGTGLIDIIRGGFPYVVVRDAETKEVVYDGRELAERPIQAISIKDFTIPKTGRYEITLDVKPEEEGVFTSTVLSYELHYIDTTPSPTPSVTAPSTAPPPPPEVVAPPQSTSVTGTIENDVNANYDLHVFDDYSAEYKPTITGSRQIVDINYQNNKWYFVTRRGMPQRSYISPKSMSQAEIADIVADTRPREGNRITHYLSNHPQWFIRIEDTDYKVEDQKVSYSNNLNDFIAWLKAELQNGYVPTSISVTGSINNALWHGVVTKSEEAEDEWVFITNDDTFSSYTRGELQEPLIYASLKSKTDYRVETGYKARLLAINGDETLYVWKKGLSNDPTKTFVLTQHKNESEAQSYLRTNGDYFWLIDTAVDKFGRVYTVTYENK